MKKRVGILLVVCLAFGLLLLGCGGNASTSSEVESARSATESHVAGEESASQGTIDVANVGDSTASTSGSSAGAGADSSASTSTNSATSSTSSPSASDASSSSASAVSSPKEKADDGLIDVYNFDSMTNDLASMFQMYLSGAKEWGDAAVEGDVASIWAYNNALEKAEPKWLKEEAALWQRYIGAEEVETNPVAGYAVDGRVVYAYFGNVGGETWMSGFFDKDGKVVFLRGTAGDSYYHCAFKDDVLISHTGGYSSPRVYKPRFIGEWDEDERLAEQERLLDTAYSNFALLRVDDMENIGEIPNDFRFGE